MTVVSGAALLMLSLLAGCAATATYRSADGLVEQTCHRRPATGGLVLWTGVWPVDAAWHLLVAAPLYAVNAIKAGSEYADCKSDLEAAGYTRTEDTP